MKLISKRCISPRVCQVLCFIILLIGRVVNFAMPFTLGAFIRALEGKLNESPWPYLFGYVVLRFLQGSGGLSAVRDVCSLHLDYVLC